jgi:hypothetical protein
MTSSSLLPVVGQRVGIKGRSEDGVVRFVGSTQFAPGVWIGVELSSVRFPFLLYSCLLHENIQFDDLYFVIWDIYMYVLTFFN